MQPINSQSQQSYIDFNSQELVQQQSLANLPPPMTEKEILLQLSEQYLSQYMSPELFEQLKKYHVTHQDVLRYIDRKTGKFDGHNFFLWLYCRIDISPQYKHDEEGRFNLPPGRPGPRKACQRDLTKFGFPEIPLTEEEFQSDNFSLRHSYKFQVHDSIAFVSDDLMDYIQEEDLYREDESDIMKRARKIHWNYKPGNLTNEGFKESQYVKKNYPSENSLIATEIHELRIRAHRGEIPLRLRLSRSFLIPAMKAKFQNIFSRAPQLLYNCWPLNASLKQKIKITLILTSLNFWSLFIFHHFLHKDVSYERH